MLLVIFAGRVMKNVNDDEIQNRFVYKISILASHNSKHSGKGDYLPFGILTGSAGGLGSGFPLWRKIFYHKTITMGGSVNINSIYYTIVSKVLCLSFLSNPISFMRTALCKP